MDPSAFYLQTTEGVTGTVSETVSGVDGAYLVPDDFLGYLATGLDYGLLTPTGLDYVLTPLIDLLAGAAGLIPLNPPRMRWRSGPVGTGGLPHRFGRQTSSGAAELTRAPGVR